MPGLRLHDAPGRPGRRLQEPLADGGRRGGAGRRDRGQARDPRRLRDGPSAPARGDPDGAGVRAGGDLRRAQPRGDHRLPARPVRHQGQGPRQRPAAGRRRHPAARRRPRRGQGARHAVELRQRRAGSSAPAAAACRSAAGAAARSWAPTPGCSPMSTWPRGSACTSARACGPTRSPPTATTRCTRPASRSTSPGSPDDMLRFAKYAVEHWGGQLEELIHTPLGYGIKNGQQVPLSFWGAATNADHFDHVHLADTNPPAKADLDGGPPQAGSGAGGGGGWRRRPGRRELGRRPRRVRPRGPPRALGRPGRPRARRPRRARRLPREPAPDLLQHHDVRVGRQPARHRGARRQRRPAGALRALPVRHPDVGVGGGHGDPRDASPEEQWMRAYLLYRQRGFQPWECADASHLGYA